MDDFYYSGAFDCVDCGVHTADIGEYYMVNDDVWTVHGVNTGMLCIGCLEHRMNRQLTSNDFSNCALNIVNNNHYDQSQRLVDRLTTP